MELNPGITHSWIVFLGEASFLAASLFFLSLLVTVKRRTPAGRIFWWLIFCLFLWTTIGFVSDLTGNISFSYWAAEATFLGPALIPLLFVVFANTLRQKPRTFRFVDLGTLALPGLVTLALTFTDYNIVHRTFELSIEGYSSEVGFLYLAYFFYLAVYMTVGAIMMIREFKTTRSRLKKLQLSYILMGAIGGSALISVTHLIIPTFSTTNSYPFGSIGAIFFFSFVAYAVFRHRFLDIRRALSVVFANFLAFATLFIVYGLLGWLFIRGITSDETLQVEPALLGIILVMILTLPWLWPRMRKYWIALLIPANPRPFTVAGPSNSNLLDLTTLGGKIVTAVQSVVPANSAQVFVKETADGPYTQVAGSNRGHFASDDELVRYFRENPKLFVREEVPFLNEELRVGEGEALERIVGRLEQMNSDVILPLANGELYGLVLIGEKTDKKAFSSNELQLLGHIQSEATMALMNVIIYKSALRQAGVRV